MLTEQTDRENFEHYCSVHEAWHAHDEPCPVCDAIDLRDSIEAADGLVFELHESLDWAQSLADDLAEQVADLEAGPPTWAFGLFVGPWTLSMTIEIGWLYRLFGRRA